MYSLSPLVGGAVLKAHSAVSRGFGILLGCFSPNNAYPHVLLKKLHLMSSLGCASIFSWQNFLVHGSNMHDVQHKAVKGWQQGQLLSVKSCSETSVMYCHKWSFITAMSEYYQKNKCYCLFPWRSSPFPGEPRNPWYCAAMPAAIRRARCLRNIRVDTQQQLRTAAAKRTGTVLTEAS